MDIKRTPDGTMFQIQNYKDIAETAGGIVNDSGLSPTDNVSTDSIRENTGKSQVKYSDRDNKYLDLAKDPEKNEAAFKNGYDAVKVVNVVEGVGGGQVTDIVLKDGGVQMKYVDLVTYDDKGNIIPLSERFNKENKDIRFSERNNDYSYDTLTSKPDMEVTVLSGKVPTNRADIVFEAKKNAAEIGTRHKDGSVSVYVDDAKSEVVLGRSGLVHGLDRRTEKMAAIIVNAGSVLKNSIKINELSPKDSNATATYVLIGTAQDTNNIYIVESIVNQYTDELVSMDVLHSINAKEKSTAVHNAPSVSTPNYRTTISISNLLDYVNKYFPDVLSEDVLEHYGHTERPAGDIGESVLFSERNIDYAKEVEAVNEELKREGEKLNAGTQGTVLCVFDKCCKVMIALKG